MKLILHIILAIIMVPTFVFAQVENTDEEVARIAQFNPLLKIEEPKPEGEEAEEETPVEEVEELTTEETPAEGEEPLPEDEELIEEELPEEKPPLVEDVVEEEIEPEPLPPEERPAQATPKKVTIDAVLFSDFTPSVDSLSPYKVKYHINMSGRANIGAAVIRGNAEIATDVTGFLAKWPGGQCLLTVSIAKVPYEIRYSQTDPDEANISIDFKKEITENWESNCTFLDGGKPLKTMGDTEKFFNRSLRAASPPINSIIAPIEPGETTTTRVVFSEEEILEEYLGTYKISGTGVVTIEPITSSSPGAAGRPAGPTSSNNIRRAIPRNIDRAKIIEQRRKARELARRRNLQ